MIKDYLNIISEFLLLYGYPILFFGIMLENIFLIGLIFPGLFILVASGFFAGTGEMNVYIALVVGILGTIIGDNISFAFGRFGLIKIGKIKRFSSKTIGIQKKIESNKGNIFIIFYHYPVYARMLVPTLLGVMKYPFFKWFKLNSIGAILFNLTFILVGYIIGLSTNIIDRAIDISMVIQWVFFVLFFYFIFSGIIILRKILKIKKSNNT